MSAIGIVLLVIGVAVSLWQNNFQWLARFGALVICVGIIVLARPALLNIDIKPHIGMAETGLSHLDPEHYNRLNQPVPEYVMENLRSRAAVGWIGPLFCFLGTLTNGFADLLNKVVGYAA